MAINVTLSNGLALTTIADYEIDTTTSLTLLGRGVPNYSQIVANDFVHLLENFSSTIAPTNPLKGQLWYNSATNILENYDGTTWHNLVTLDYLISQGYISNNQAIVISGDATGSGSTNIVLTLSPIAGLAAGTYEKVTVNTKGQVTSGTNLTTTDLTTAAGAALTINGVVNSTSLVLQNGGGGSIKFADGTVQTTAPVSSTTSLGFTPVQQGTGNAQIAGATVKIGYVSTGTLNATVNTTDFGAIAFQNWTTPNFVNMNNGIGQATNIVKLGWSTAGKLKCTIDFTDQGNIAMESWVTTNYQTKLGFNPVQGGTGVRQGANIIKLGWTTDGHVACTVDTSDEGNIVLSNASTGAVGISGTLLVAGAATFNTTVYAGGVISSNSAINAAGTITGGSFATGGSGNINVGTGASNISGSLTVGSLLVGGSRVIFNNTSTGNTIYLGYTGTPPYVQLTIDSTSFGSIVTNAAAFWPNAISAQGYQKMPNGFIIQWGQSTIETGNVINTRNFPITFPNTALSVVGTFGASVPPGTGAIGFQAINNSQYQVNNTAPAGGSDGYWYIAVGY